MLFVMKKNSSKYFNRDSFTDEKSPIIESSAQNYFCSRPHQLIEIVGGFRGTWVFVANSWLLNRIEMHVKTNSFILFVQMDIIKMLVTDKNTFHARDVNVQKFNPWAPERFVEKSTYSWWVRTLWLVKYLQHCSH